MRKTILFLLFLCQIMCYGQDDSTVDIVASIGGSINVSVLGGAVYSVPLDIPQGVNGMQPEIGLVYNSQGGNGLLGYGWNINGISTITRTGSTLYHDGKTTAADFSEDDRFLLDGQRLIPVGNNNRSLYEYKTENDEFSKIVFTKENGYFSKCEVRLENGNIIKYGYTANSKLMAADGNNVIKWMVSSIEDRNGNTVSYLYETYGTDSDIYIKEISYTSNSLAGLSSQFKVSFTYSNNRFDDYHYYIAGNKILCSRLLTGINVIKGNETLASYGFSYDGISNRMYNLLTEISLSKGGYELEPTVIRWNTNESDIQNNSLYSQQISASILNDFSFVGDFNGDGYSDLLTVPYRPQPNGYSGNITAKVYLNNTQGGFSSAPSSTLTLADSLDWIHVIDINGDGYDDIVVQTLKLHSGTYFTGFVVYESQQGNGFSNVYSYCDGNRYMVRAGDFLGEGRNCLLLIKINVHYPYGNYAIVGCPAVLHYDNGYVFNYFIDSLSLVEGLVITGDYNGDGKTQFKTVNGDEIVHLTIYKQNGNYRLSRSYEQLEFCFDMTSAVFSGDFNNDGKDDILFSETDNEKYVILSTGDSFTEKIVINNNRIRNIVFPTPQTYFYSLDNVTSNTAYGLNVSDIDGDGKTDILFYNGNNKPVFFRNFNVTNPETPSGLFKIEYVAENTDIQFKNQYFTIGNFLGEDHVSFVAVDPMNPSNPNDDKVKVFSFPSTAERFSVSSITDGMGKTTELEYDYLMPGRTDFYTFTNRPFVNDVKPFPMPMKAMKSYTEIVGSNSYKTGFRYGNVLIHRKGRGFVNFEDVEKTTYINNVAVKQEKSRFELATMGANALALPQCDSTFLFDAGNKILSETSAYTFQNIGCSRQISSGGLRHIVRPAMVAKKTKRFNPDTQGQLLSVELTEYTYNYQSGNTYADTYACTSVQNGVNATDCATVSACSYQNSKTINYAGNNITAWIINRKSEETTVTQYLSQPSVTRKTKYTYTSGNPFLISTKTDIPGTSDTNPLTVRYTYQYDNCGNVVTETVSAPYGTYNEAPVVTGYTYNNYRLVATKTVDPNGLSYQDQYTYDKYDRVTSHVGSNGLTTTYVYGNPFGTSVDTYAPGNVTTTEYLAWAAGEDLAPSNALYYKYSQTTGSPITATFYDAGGNALRTLTVNYASDMIISDVCYNSRQLPIQQSYPYLEGDTPQWTTFQYDGLGRLTSTTTPDGTVISNIYNGLTTTTTTASGNTTHTTAQTVNFLGWVINSTDASQNEVTYIYYSDGKIATMATSGGSVTVNMAYDDAGNRISLIDSDYGRTTSEYDAFGRLIQQYTPNDDCFSYSYDVIGRVTQKTIQGDATTTSYLYNENTHKGTLASVTHNGQSLQYAYDSYDRLITVTETRADTAYTTSYEYNNKSQISSMTYPSGYKVYYGYYNDGSKKHVKDSHGTTLWKANEINACGQLIRATTGNGAVTTNIYDAATNRLTGSATSNGIQNFAYTFDGFGNLTSRTDSIGTVKTETFTYDNLDRLTGITLNNVSSAMVYDGYGRMTSKQKDGSTLFSSAQFSARKPHATRSVSTTSTEFPDSQSIEYNSLDKVKRLTQGSKTATFTYGYDGQRTRMTVTDTVLGTTRTKDYVDGCEFVNDNGVKKTYTYLMGPYGVFAMVISSGGNHAVHYVYKDHLGSWTTITDSIGTVVERKSFDAWGNLRNPQTWSGVNGRTPRFDRGFTGHEHLYAFGLINMNGRMYDPLLSSFLSPDNYMQDPTSQQGFNRYAYCMYNPLKYVDPTGERCYGWYASTYYYEQLARQYVRDEQYRIFALAMASTWRFTPWINTLYSEGYYVCGNRGGSTNHGSGGGEEIIGTEAFQKLCEKHGIEPGKPIPKEKLTGAFLKEFQELCFPDAPMDYVRKFVVDFDDTRFCSTNSEGEKVIHPGRTYNLSKNGFSTGKSYVYFNGNYEFNNLEALFYAMGHELIHVSQNILSAGYPTDFLTNQAFIDVKEHWAYTWQTGAGDMFPYSIDTASLTTYSNYAHPLYPSIMVDYTDMMNYRHFKWLQNVIYPPF